MNSFVTSSRRLANVRVKPTRSRRGLRQGISLMEVLISIAVVAIGLLGVAALIPAGGKLAQEGARNDRLSNVGRRAFREFNVRQMNREDRWAFANTSPATDPKPLVRFTQNAPPAAGFRAFCIDARALGQLTDVTDSGYFLRDKVPVSPNRSRFPLMGTPVAAMARVTLGRQIGLGNAILGAHADDIFVFQDELQFELPDQKTAPPIQTMIGAGAKRYAQGEFSWLVTIVPDLHRIRDPSGTTFLPKISIGSHHQVSVAIVAQRNTFQPEEVVPVTAVPGGGVGGGEFVFAPIQTKLHIGDWIMLARMLPVDLMGAGTVIEPGIGIFKWYRVMAIGEGAGTSANQLTLNGPDWHADPALPPYQGFNNDFAIIIPGVKAVYTKATQIVPVP